MPQIELYKLRQAYTIASIGSFYAFILSRSDRVRLTVVARSNYDAVKANVRRASFATCDVPADLR